MAANVFIYDFLNKRINFTNKDELILRNDEKIEFDMALTKVCFKYNKKTRQVTSLSKFSRALKFYGKKNIFA